MSQLTAFWRRMMLLLRRDRATADLEEEMRLHRELRAATFTDRGIDARDALHAARLSFGRPDDHIEQSRDAWGVRALDDFRQDVRFAFRRLRQRRAFTFAVVGILALGTGATTAMFSAVDAAILRPLPFPHSAQIVTVPSIDVPSNLGGARPRGAVIDVPALASMHDLFARVAVMASGGLNFADPDHPQRLAVGVVSSEFFPLLGVAPIAGRTFSADEGKPGGARSVILSYGAWQRLFSGRDVLQKTMVLNDRSYEVIGVMPRGFVFPNASDVWIPMTIPVTLETFEPFHGFLGSQVIARLAPGVTPEVASHRLLAQWTRVYGAPADAATKNSRRERLAKMATRGTVIPLQRLLLGNRETPLLVLLGATGVLLLIACANVTNLLLSQAVTRRREIAVREVLGARKGRVIRQLLTESVLLSLAGVAVGVALAPALLKVLANLLPAALTGVSAAHLDLRVLAFAVVLALVTGIGFGIWPALGTVGNHASAIIRGGGGHGATARAGGRTRRVLLTTELALTLVLLVGAGLMLRSFARMMSVDRGMQTNSVGTLDVAFPINAPDIAARTAAILAHLAATPGIRSVGTVNDLPLGGGGGILLDVVPQGIPPATGESDIGAHQLIASGGYFDAMGIRLIAGRTFTPADDAHGAQVAIISATAAKMYWRDANPVGRTFSSSPTDPNLVTVVGVVADVSDFGLEEKPIPQLYLSAYRDARPTVTIVARGTLAPSALVAAIEHAVHAVDRSQAVFHKRTMEEVLNVAVTPRRTNTILIGLFAAIALCIALVGVYAVVSHSVAQRAREFGIRSALGARGSDLLTLVCRELTWVLAIGISAGLGASWALTTIATSMLFGIAAHDPVTFATVPLLLIAAAVVATLVPARRAARVNPAVVMRAE